MMMMMQTSRSWQQESEVEQRKQHKQPWPTDGANISAAYDRNSDNDDGNHGVVHNENNDGSPSSSTNFSTSAIRQREQELPPTGQQRTRIPSAGPGTSSSISISSWTMLLTLLSISALTSSANVSTTSHVPINGSIGSTDYILLPGDSTTALIPVQTTTGISGVGGDGLAELEDEEDAEKASEYIFDRTDVRIIFITLYTLVFCCCFFGNLLVILVVTLSRRLRSITNFFLANLAFADFCVGLFCVMQNLSIYLIESWVFGEFLCRMYQFVHSLSYTASIFILVVICMERYFAIVHPITCKQILTAARLRMVIVTVWITSAVYSTPKFVFSKTIKNIHTQDGQEEEICVLDREMFNSKLLDMINFVLLYVMPLLVMTVLYSKIAIALWRSSRGLTPHVAQHHQHQQPQQASCQDGGMGMGMHNSMYHHHQHHHHQMHHQLPSAASAATSAGSAPQPGGGVGGGGGGGPGSSLASAGSSTTSLSRKQSSKYEKRGVSITESQLDNCKVSLEADRPIVSACRKTSFYHHSHAHHQRSGGATGGGGVGGGVAGGASHMSHSSSNVLRARRGVVRMLIIFVLTFALCNLPYHARKMWQYWSRSYRGDSNFNALLTPLTFLVTYFNSGVNPLLYAFLSRNFRKGMKELLLCSWKKGKGKSSSNSSMHHKRKALQTHSLPTDTTHIGNEQL
ncbi:trissin receptor isoform X1 [Drosophila subpulchrella]|uniref:trissin receptor isoform X1 n=1 Tax=Drosophila subpulchrella TaxID=1486046 RepID=UPI0018A15A60|nr:trissin receptor isoform X1 [Drosophila subpulchrella]XP_037710895.1 trissin receptor isoform X1 [Drosophila subpulchrella]XP_037710896.1 trissin receptor isoform X1 [Drosophila subpulchrella]XP_037710897.1 trissin receptor isoform X1 [Drosophila subpulchrella]